MRRKCWRKGDRSARRGDRQTRGGASPSDVARSGVLV